jgi:hypothetical protein
MHLSLWHLQRQIQPSHTNIATRVTAPCGGRIIEQRQLLSHWDHRWHADTTLAPGAVRSIQNNGSVLSVPTV